MMLHIETKSNNTHLQFDAESEQFECSRDELVSLNKVLDVRQSGENDIKTIAPAQDGSHLVVFLLVHVPVLPAVQPLHNVLCRVPKETTHTVHHTHALTMLQDQWERR